MGLFLRLSPSVGASLTLVPSHVSAPRSPNPACRFPALGSPVGSCRSPTGRSGSDGNGASGDTVRVAGVARPRPLPGGRRTRRQASSRPAACACGLGLRAFLHSLPFAFACGGSSPLERNAGVLGHATPGVLRAFTHLSSPEVPSLRRRYPASPVVRTSPPP